MSKNPWTGKRISLPSSRQRRKAKSETFGYAEIFHRKRPRLTVAQLRKQIESYQTQPKSEQIATYSGIAAAMAKAARAKK